MSVLAEAEKAVNGARHKDYGHPRDNHGTTAVMMRAFLTRRYGGLQAFDALDVCAFNILQKMSRLANTPNHHDSLVDICGYSENWERILAEPEPPRE